MVEVRNDVHEIIAGYAIGPAYLDEYVFQDDLKLRFFRGLAHGIPFLSKKPVPGRTPGYETVP